MNDVCVFSDLSYIPYVLIDIFCHCVSKAVVIITIFLIKSSCSR